VKRCRHVYPAKQIVYSLYKYTSSTSYDFVFAVISFLRETLRLYICPNMKFYKHFFSALPSLSNTEVYWTFRRCFFVFWVADLGVTRRAGIFKKQLIHLSHKTFFVITRRKFLIPATVKWKCIVLFFHLFLIKCKVTDCQPQWCKSF